MPAPRLLELFADSFDVVTPSPEPAAPEPPAAPPPPPPVYTQADIAAAQARGRAEGFAQATTEAAAAEAARVATAVARIAELLADAQTCAARVADESATALAKLVLAAVHAGYRELRARHGAAEVAALVRSLMPALVQEARVTIHVHPGMVAGVNAELAAVPASERQHITLELSELIAPGDARITWPKGEAVRKVGVVETAIADVLGPLAFSPNRPASLMTANHPASLTTPNHHASPTTPNRGR